MNAIEFAQDLATRSVKWLCISVVAVCLIPTMFTLYGVSWIAAFTTCFVCGLLYVSMVVTADMTFRKILTEQQNAVDSSRRVEDPTVVSCASCKARVQNLTNEDF